MSSSCFIDNNISNNINRNNKLINIIKRIIFHGKYYIIDQNYKIWIKNAVLVNS